jgi:hypothetical protein
VKRRIAIIVISLAALGGLAAGQHASAEPLVPDTSSGTWGCVTVRNVAGTCINNPFAPFDDRGVVGVVTDTARR